MNKNTENMPTEIFDWLQTSDFKSLVKDQQKQVLLYFSEEEFNAMHLAADALKMVNSQNNSRGEGLSKAALLERFDKQHTKIVYFYKQPVFYWQAAAMFLLLLSGWLFYRTYDIKTSLSDRAVASTDTIYVNRDVKSEPEIIHDTVYRYKMIKEARKQREELHVSNSSESTQDNHLNYIQAIDLKEIHNAANSIRRNSMKDDSLLKKYGYVTM